jgi:hypothetical protein
MASLKSLARKYEEITDNIVKFHKKGNEYKVGMWTCRLVDVTFALEEFSRDELLEVSKKYRTVLELT